MNNGATPPELTEEQQALAVRREEMEAITEKEMARKVFNLAWPATVEAILQTTIRMVTSALLGHIPGYSALAISASGLADRITRISWGLFTAVGTGATVMIARSFGAGNKDRANHYAAQSLVLGSILMVAITAVLYLFSTELIVILYNRDGAMDRELVSMSISYLS